MGSHAQNPDQPCTSGTVSAFRYACDPLLEYCVYLTGPSEQLAIALSTIMPASGADHHHCKEGSQSGPPCQLIGLPPLQRSSNIFRNADSVGNSMPLIIRPPTRPRKCDDPQSFAKARLILVGPSRRRSSGALE